MSITRRGLLSISVAAAMLSTTPALGVELELSARGEGGYNDNAFGAAQDKTDDIVLQFRPRAALVDRGGDVTWRFAYQPRYEYFVDADTASGWSHDVLARMEWRITPRLNLEVTERFSRVQSVNRFFDELAPEEFPAVPDIEFRTQRTKRNRLEAGLRYALAAGKTITLNGTWSIDDFSTARGDNDLLSTSIRYLQQLTPRDQLGGGFSVARNTVEGTGDDRPDRTSLFYNLFATWGHAFDETFRFDVSAGPALIDGDDVDDPRSVLADRVRFPLLTEDGERRLIDVDSCPRDEGFIILGPECEPLPTVLRGDEASAIASLTSDLPLLGGTSSTSQTSITFFANMVLSKRWETWTGSLSYQRSEATSSGFGSSTVADAVLGTLTWRPSPRWRFDFIATFVRREQIGETSVAAIVLDSSRLTLPCPQEFIVTSIFGRPIPPTCVASAAGVNRPLTLGGVAEAIGFKSVEVDQSLETRDYGVRINGSYQIRKNISLIGNVIWTRQETDNGAVSRNDVDNFRANIGLEYRFDPIHL